ncbi:hypothetical protein [Endozoicomonas lisbonensis]|uniref:hypothetical protein n=1 Tax=Endozoicomonas lisbonensis TaxID=3120522 RepID=UPI0033946D75
MPISKAAYLTVAAFVVKRSFFVEKKDAVELANRSMFAEAVVELLVSGGAF